MVKHPLSDSLFKEHISIARLTSKPILEKIAFGPNEIEQVTRMGAGFSYYERIPGAKGYRCFSINGFSLHANPSTNTLLRDHLRTLVEFTPPVACLMNT